jgi:hypothetical protein
MQHHAFLYVSHTIESLPKAARTASEDVTHVTADVLGIDEVRALTLQSVQRPLTEEKRVFVIHTKNITSEAQNALLKLFEEPPETAEFHLMLPKDGLLLPTLMSRLYVVANEEDQPVDVNNSFNTFFEAAYSERMNMIADLAKSKDIENMESIVRGVELFAHKSRNAALLKDVSFVRTYFGARGSSSKMLLEMLATSLPKK